MDSSQGIRLGIGSDVVKSLRQIAVAHGYISDRGKQVGQGNVTALMRAIADGSLMIGPSPAFLEQQYRELKLAANGLIVCAETIHTLVDTAIEELHRER